MKIWTGLYYSVGSRSLTWAEIGTFLKECWWLVALFFILFIPRAYLLHKEHKQMMEEQEEQERLRERYGEPTEKAEEHSPYENAPPSAGVPDGGDRFGASNYIRPRYEWRIMVSLLTISFIVGSGAGFGGSGDVLMLLMLVVLIGVVIVMKHLGPGWMYTSFEKDREKKMIDWKRLGKELLPYGAAVLIGLVLGLVRLLMAGR